MKRVLVILAVAGITLSAGPDEEQIKKKAARIHKKALTVDSHVDTPMWLTREGYDFGQRHDPYTTPNKLDIPRMQEGGLDGVFFAVFIGQGDRTPEGNAKAYQEAHEIIDSIESTVDRYSKTLEIVTKEADLGRMEKEGKHAIYLGMENGYPLGTALSLVDTFYNCGVRYITLTHSYNNDICDSSTDSTEHGGLSDFGRQVVKRMNELGIMIDLSHASDETFYQVVEMSDKPVMQAALSVFEYIESWYNTDRIHSALEMSIKEFNAINNNHKLVA